GLAVVVNLNCGTPPAWADSLAAGPLFSGQRTSSDPDQRTELAHKLLKQFMQSINAVRDKQGGPAKAPTVPGSGSEPMYVDWHLGDRDLSPEARPRLREVVKCALCQTSIRFVFDRQRRSISLAEGMDRKHEAVLLTVGLNLPALANQPGASSNPNLF